VVTGGEHLCNLTHPDAYNALISSFAARLEETGTRGA
jgi:hypothetical protein